MPVTQTVATTITVEFDDLGEKKTLSWVQEQSVPKSAEDIVQVIMFDGTKLVFSNKDALVAYFQKLSKAKTPPVVNIAEYKPVQKMDGERK